MIKNFIFLAWIFVPLWVFPQELLRFKVTPEKGTSVTPVAVSLDRLQLNLDSGRVALFETGPKGETEVPCQLEKGVVPLLWYLFDPSGGEKKYVLRKVWNTGTSKPGLTLVTSEQATTILHNGIPVVSYNHAVVYPPEGVDGKFKRSGYIHPLYSPGGEVLTRIQAPDHYHHYGIWNPWTKTTIDGREIDFWNLIKGEGTVQFSGYLDKEAGAVYAGFRVHQEHLFFQEHNRDKIALNEVWDVRVWNVKQEKVTVLDLTTTLNTPLASGIMLEAYRYGGGIGYRATEKWTRENCTVLTSEGKSRAEADGTNARWCLVEGESSVPEGRSGILFLSHPSNRKHPEPMRVWPPDANNGRGDLFFEFCPIRHEGWKLEPLNKYLLRYRMIIFDGKMSPQEAESWWKGFAVAPKVNMDCKE